MNVDEQMRELERRLSDGEEFPAIEDWVDEIPADEEVKAALWLVAWTEQEPVIQRRVAWEALAYVAATEG